MDEAHSLILTFRDSFSLYSGYLLCFPLESPTYKSRLLPVKTESRKFSFHFHVSLALSYQAKTTARFMIKTVHIFKICNVRHTKEGGKTSQNLEKVNLRRVEESKHQLEYSIEDCGQQSPQAQHCGCPLLHEEPNGIMNECSALVS